MADKKTPNDDRTKDPYVDRRSGDDRREVYDADYFEENGEERRKGKERRKKKERRDGYVKTGDWTSIRQDDDSDDKS